MGENYMIPMKDSNTIDFEALLEQDPMLLKILAARKDTPAIVLTRLACHYDTEVKAAVAKNASTPPEVLEVLIEGDEYKCAIEAASNPSTPASALARVVRKEAYGHVDALRNDNTPLESILSYLMSNAGESEKAALNFNKRFSSLIRIAEKLDAEHEAKKQQSAQHPSELDFDVDSDDIEAWRS